MIGGLYQPLAGSDLRPRGVLDGDSGVELDCVSTDVREHAELAELLNEALAMARDGGRADSARCARGAAADVRLAWRLPVPDDLPVRAVSSRDVPQLETLPGMEPAGAPPSGDGPALTIEQEQAIGRRAEPLLVSAAAGSGKTSVLVERFVRAVREDGVAPAQDPRDHLHRARGGRAARARAGAAARAGRATRRRATPRRRSSAPSTASARGCCAPSRWRPGWTPTSQMLDEGLAGRLRKRAFEGAVRSWLAEDRAEAVDLLAAYGVDRVAGMLEQVYAELRSRGERMPRLPAPALDGDAAEEELEAAGVARCSVSCSSTSALAYERLKRARSAVDFDDLELLARALLLERAAVRVAWAERFELLDGRRVPGHQPAPAGDPAMRSIAATCSRSATSCSRSTASATPT